MARSPRPVTRALPTGRPSATSAARTSMARCSDSLSLAAGSPVVSVWPGLVKTEFVSSGATEFAPGRYTIQLPGQEPFELTS